MFSLVTVLVRLVQLIIPAVLLYLIYRGYSGIVTRRDGIQAGIRALRPADSSPSSLTGA